MEKKQTIYKIKGMSRDLNNMSFDKEHSFENKNIRITADKDNGLLSITNEKGTKFINENLHTSKTFVIGYAVVENDLIIFSKGLRNDSDKDCIFKLTLSENAEENKLDFLYRGNLGFSKDHPIETLVDIENYNIKKVYWVDGINPLRVININKDYISESEDPFAFVLPIKTNHIFSVEKGEPVGQFPAGVIQYAFTYFNKFGQESAVVDVSPIYYIAHEGRGASPEDIVTTSFNLTFSNLDSNWEYIRIYSIIRTSLNTTPEIKKIVDLPLLDKVEYIDTNTYGENIAPTDLLYKGGEVLSASTIAQKDSTLFLGGIDIKNTNIISEDLKQEILDGIDFEFEGNMRTYSLGPIPDTKNKEYYLYQNHLNSPNRNITTFKSSETYRIGIQLQDKYGKWTDPIFLGDYKNNIHPSDPDDNNECYISTGVATISTSLQNSLKKQNFTNIRPLIVFPTESDRECICQGILCPTVFNVKDRAENTPYVQSSWYVRSNLPKITEDSDDTNAGMVSTNKHYSVIPAFNTVFDSVPIKNGEFGGYLNLPKTIYPEKENDISKDVYIKNYSEAFFVDKNIVTLHSPEIEFNNSILSKNLSKCNLRIVGIAPINASVSDIYVDYNGTISTNKYAGFNKTKIHSYNSSYSAYKHLINGNFWWDTYHYVNKDQGINTKEFRAYKTGLWNPTNQLSVSPDITNKHVLNKSRHSIYQISNCINYFDTIEDKWENIDIGVYNKNTLGYVKLGDYFYSGKSNKIIFTEGTKSWCTADEIATDNMTTTDITQVINASAFEHTVNAYNTPIHITYDSSPHCVLSLDSINHGQSYLEPFNSNEVLKQGDDDGLSFWGENLQYTPLSYRVPDDQHFGYVFIGELYREVDELNRFGGNSEYAIQNNLWIPAGESVPIDAISILWTQGDTYYQRYDHIKTTPVNEEDKNGITSIISFMCETRINLDGRYDDRYKAVENGLYVVSDKFNNLNSVYSQQNNYFNYRVLDSERFNITKFPNSIVWSKTKLPNNIIDPWLNINLASTLDLDGNKGNITSLKRFNNEIIAFQDKAVAQVLYNTRTQISATDGVPIEIANSGKVDGKRYISDNIGCLNKWSICESPNGIYFIDDYNKSINIFNTQGVQSLSEMKGFHSWINNKSSIVKWNPEVFDNAITYRDPINNEILFVYKDTCLIYNELLSEFTSFYDYGGSYPFVNLNGRNIIFNDNIIYGYQEGEYNNIFGKNKEYYIDIIANENPLNDKIFTNIEFRADTYNDDESKILDNKIDFNTLSARNEYQHSLSKLSYSQNRPSNLKKKFRIWRADIPRDGKNRIRNTWTHIKLSSDATTNRKTRLHDLSVIYYV